MSLLPPVRTNSSWTAGASGHFYGRFTFVRFGRGSHWSSTAEANVFSDPPFDPLLWLVFFLPLLHLPVFR